MNQIRDFKLYKWQCGPQQGRESLWLFRLAKCDDFAHVLNALRALPADVRHYYADEEVWALKPSKDREALLANLFDNFKAEIHLARQQPGLPVFEQIPVQYQLPWLNNQGVEIIQGRR
jgi:hypothetical protein